MKDGDRPSRGRAGVDLDHPDVAARRRAGTREARRRRARRRRTGLLGVLAGAALTAVAVALLSGGGEHPAKGDAHRHARAGRPSTASASTRSTAVRASKQVRSSGTPTAEQIAAAGSLPQTHAFPSAGDRRFKTLMASLWAGIVKNSPSVALPAFFPKRAYVQLKAISSAESDWSGRLVHDYALDLGAAHALLGPNAPSAELVRVNVESSYGHWVPPGVCSNGIGYYEMPGARLVYRQGGGLRSFGIASMISWRGVWYVVHLGAVLRSGESGVVDEPASGAGTPAYSGTC